MRGAQWIKRTVLEGIAQPKINNYEKPLLLIFYKLHEPVLCQELTDVFQNVLLNRRVTADWFGTA